MKIFISQPMRNMSNETIKKEREKIIKQCELKDCEVIDTIFDFGDKPAMYYLAKSIEAMSEADIVIFANGWEEARGCRIEYEVAKNYGKEIAILGDATK